MRSESRNKVAVVSPLSPSIQAALALFLAAGDDQRSRQPPPGEPAIAIARLRSSGLSDAELQWLVDLQLVEPRETVPTRRTGLRRRHVLTDQPRTASFRLTRAGVLWATEILGVNVPVPPTIPADAPPDHTSPDPSALPFWDADNRTLWWGDQILLRFHRRHAPNLEPLLAAFQRQHWKPCIADPLACERHSKFDSRLHDAIKYLNKRLKGTPLRFHGSGDGKGVRWEAVGATIRRSSPEVP